MALSRAHGEHGIRNERGHVLGMRERDDVVAVAVPEAHGHRDLAQGKPPIAREEHEIGGHGVELSRAGLGEVVEKHGSHLRTFEHAPIALRRELAVDADAHRPDRSRDAEDSPQRMADGDADGLYQRRAPRRDADDPARRGLLAARGSHTAEYRGDGNAVREERRTRQRVRPAAREARDSEPVDAEHAGELDDVVRETSDVHMEVGRGSARARPFDEDEANAEVARDGTGVEWDLATPARGPVEPDDGSPGWVAILTEAQSPAAGERDDVAAPWFEVEVGGGHRQKLTSPGELHEAGGCEPLAGMLGSMDLATALEFAATRRHGVLVTLRRDGRAQTSDIVYAIRDGVAHISVTADRAKTANLRRDPRAVLHVSVPEAWSYVSLDGSVELSDVTREAGDAVGRELAEYYELVSGGPHPNWDEYFTAMVDERRLVARFHPQSATGAVRG